MDRLLLGSRVILCTLSMLSNNRIGIVSQIVPVQTVIVDEASQIEIGAYIPLLSEYQRTLRKIVFIGDDKQRKFSVGVTLNTRLNMSAFQCHRTDKVTYLS